MKYALQSWGWLSAALVVGVFFALEPARAQYSGPDTSKPLFSSGEKQAAAKAQPKKGREASQEELADAVLGDALNQIWVQTDRHFHEGEYNHIINLNRIIVQGDPHNMESYSNNAWLLWSIGVDRPELTAEMNKEADEALKQGVEANQKSYYMYDEAGRHYLLLRKDAPTALAYFEQAVKFDCPWFTWNNLAECYEKSGQWEKAVSAWEKAAMYPDNRVARRRLRQVKDRIAQQKNGQ